jgi:hypothetical protein
MEVCMDEWVDIIWMDGWMDIWMDEWMDIWMDICYCFQTNDDRLESTFASSRRWNNGKLSVFTNYSTGSLPYVGGMSLYR